ncbi:MAG: hypothetical protein BGO26_08860 [Actinobacteria bacterium 69-20]|nr:MAG: hypothetical protein BGO26_08860 [Actinobacteria bacterium 69-20]
MRYETKRPDRLMSVAGSAIGAHAGMITDMGAMVASANGPTVLALPWGEMLIFAAVSLLALAAVVYVVVAALRGRLRPGRALFAVLIAVFIPIIGAVLVVWIVAAEARCGELSADRLVVGGSPPRARDRPR